MKYTDEQLEVATFKSKNLLVSSLAGTGKTEVVSLRINNLLKKDNRLLCLCFTNAAVSQLSSRLMVKGMNVEVSTIDAYAAQILSPFGIRVGDCLSVIKSVFQSFGLNTSANDLKGFQKLASFNLFQNSETNVFIPGLSPEMIVKLFALYDAKKTELGILDFQDAIILATRFVEQYPERFEFSEVIIDEAQDLNPLQMKFVNVLSRAGDLTFVGDKNQSIFSFAGVNVNMFEENCSGWDELYLSKSFRSGKKIIEAVNKTLAPISSKTLITDKKSSTVNVGNENDSLDWLDKHVDDKPAVLGLTRFDLIKTANKFEENGLRVWRSWIDTKSTIESFDIIFSSIHKAKGLEFKSVLVKNIPQYGYGGFDGDRLLYVALSRAEDNLFLQKANDSLPEIFKEL